jgi:hypothetical protein
MLLGTRFAGGDWRRAVIPLTDCLSAAAVAAGAIQDRRSDGQPVQRRYALYQLRIRES